MWLFTQHINTQHSRAGERPLGVREEEEEEEKRATS